MRKGTLVYTPQPPDFGGLNGIESNSSRINEIDVISVNKRQKLPPDFGGTEGGIISNKTSQILLKPIESIKAGDLVIGHDGKPHRVTHSIERQFHGEMIGIKNDQSEKTLYLPEHQRILSQRRVQQLTPNGLWSGIPPSHFGRARELRKEASPPERILWKFLSGEQLGVKFRRQHPIGPYIADFYSRDCGLVVEVDGEANHSNPQQIEYDQVRDDFMNRLGLNVLRIPARDVIKQPENAIKEIMHHTLEYVLDEDYQKQWLFAENMNNGDIIYQGIDHKTCSISASDKIQINERLIYLQIQDIHSYITSVAIVHDESPILTNL